MQVRTNSNCCAPAWDAGHFSSTFRIFTFSLVFKNLSVMCLWWFSSYLSYLEFAELGEPVKHMSFTNTVFFVCLFGHVPQGLPWLFHFSSYPWTGAGFIFRIWFSHLCGSLTCLLTSRFPPFKSLAAFHPWTLICGTPRLLGLQFPFCFLSHDRGARECCPNRNQHIHHHYLFQLQDCFCFVLFS